MRPIDIIKVMDDTLSNKIAAGEVVERPASIVKELVENAIDAESTVIEIGLEEAGLLTIRGTDNGNGMSKKMLFKRLSGMQQVRYQMTMIYSEFERLGSGEKHLRVLHPCPR